MSKKRDALIVVILVVFGLLIIPRIIDKSMVRLEKIENIERAMEQQTKAVAEELKEAEERLGVSLKKDAK